MRRTWTWPAASSTRSFVTSPTSGGAFAASLDADTDGEEGATYTWTADEIRSVLGERRQPLFATAYGVTDAGNWEGRTILSRVQPDRRLAEQYGLRESEVSRIAWRRLASASSSERRARPQPGRDDKALAAWNGLAIRALADAARLLDLSPAGIGRPAGDTWPRPSLRPRTITRGLLADDGRLGRSWKDGRASSDGVLEDYANLAEGLLALYEATFDEHWFSVGPAAHGHRARPLHRPGRRVLRHRGRP